MTNYQSSITRENSSHIGIKGNEVVDKEAKQAIDMPGMTTTRLPYTDYLLPDLPNGKRM